MSSGRICYHDDLAYYDDVSYDDFYLADHFSYYFVIYGDYHHEYFHSRRTYEYRQGQVRWHQYRWLRLRV